MARAVHTREADAVALMRFAVALVGVLAIAWTAADGDLWGHVRFGEDILDQHSLTKHDPYSFTSDRPWVNHEWLSELLIGLGYRAGGALGLVVLKTLLALGVFAFVVMALRRVRWRPVDHDLLIVLAVTAAFARLHFMRPQVFSLLLFAALLYVLIAADRGGVRALVAVPVIMALWGNLHGAWLVGFATLSVWVLIRMLRLGAPRIDRRWLLGVWAAGVTATLLNPYGTGLWTYLHQTVGLSRPEIRDWQPLFELSPVLIAPALAAAAVAVTAVVKARRHADPAYVLIVFTLALATLRISRFDAFFGVAVVMLLGPYLGRVRARAVEGRQAAAMPWRRPLGAAVAVSLVAIAGGYSASALDCLKISDEPEPQSTAFLAHRQARVLTYFNWGQYAIWHLAPGIKVSMDGRRDTVYSDALLDAHIRLYFDKPGATALVKRLRPDLIWLPVRFHVVKRLRRQGWRPIFRGPISVVLSRRGRDHTIVRSVPHGQRCFPAY